jgi:DNA-binding NarL/FixJ family response regulator
LIDWTVALREGSEPPLTPVEGRFRVLLVAPRLLISRGLAALLDDAPEFRVCAEARDLDEATALATRQRPDLALVSMEEEQEAIALVQLLLPAHPPLRVLVLAREEQPFYAEAAIRAGARGYIATDSGADVLVGACRRIAAGEIVLGDAVVERLMIGLSDSRTREGTPSGTALSARETQVLELIGRGLVRREIAQRLELSAKTVDIYRERLRAKLHINSMVELYRFAAQWVQ